MPWRSASDTLEQFQLAGVGELNEEPSNTVIERLLSGRQVLPAHLFSLRRLLLLPLLLRHCCYLISLGLWTPFSELKWPERHRRKLILIYLDNLLAGFDGLISFFLKTRINFKIR